MIRSSQHILKYSNQSKLKEIENFFESYKINLTRYINLIITKQLPLQNNLSSKLLPIINIESSRWRQNIYKQSSEIVRSNIKFQNDKRFKKYKRIYNYFKKNNRQINFLNKKYSELNLKSILHYININVKNITINIDNRFLNFEKTESSEFNEFIGFKIPINNGNIKTKQINIPIKYHKHSLKYKDWHRKNTVQLLKINDNFYIKFIYEKENVIQKTNNNSLGIDIGYKKLISDSNGRYYGIELEDIYKTISNKKRNSKNYKQKLIYKKNKINEICNDFIKDNRNISHIICEDLKNVKNKSKFNKKFNNKLQYWSYKQTLVCLDMKCQEHGIQMVKVLPFYTSQTCSKCGTIDKNNRNGENYNCSCGNNIDADHNASINILHRGIYSSSNKKSNIFQ